VNPIVPTPAEIVRMITAVAEAVVETNKTLQTPEGKAWMNTVTSDRAKWDAWVSKVPGWVSDLFTGRLFKSVQSPVDKS